MQVAQIWISKVEFCINKFLFLELKDMGIKKRSVKNAISGFKG